MRTLSTLAVAVAALLLLAAWFTAPIAVDVGERDLRFTADFHDPETFATSLARWTSDRSLLLLPRSARVAQQVLTLRLINARPQGAALPDVRVAVDGRDLGSLPIGPSEARRYMLLLPASAAPGWAQQVQISATPLISPSDPRPLGVVVDWASAAPLGGGLPSPWALGLIALLAALAYALPRRAGLGHGLAGGVAAAALLALAAAAWQRPNEVLPFLPRVAALLGIGVLGVSLARALAPPERAGRGWSVAGRDLPLYLAVAPWMGPLFQWFETWDGAEGVTPPPATAVVLAGVALAFAGVGVWAFATRPAGQRLALVRRWALPIFAVAGLCHLGTMLQFSLTRSGPDFWILFKGARDWARGGSLYNLQDVVTNHFGSVFKVPPFYGMLFVPFVFQDGTLVLLGHRILNIVILAATMVVWYRIWGIRVASVLGGAMLVLFNFRPLADTVAFGQIDLVLLLTLTMALWALRGERDLLAGVLVALGTLFKIYPVLLLAFFVVKRSWKGLLGFALGMLLFNGLAVAVMGWEMHRIYLFEVFPKIGGTTSWVENQTVSGMVARLVEPPNKSLIFHQPLFSLAATLISGLIGLVACLLSLPHAERRSPEFALQYGQFLLAMVLVVPAAWMHYETLLVIPFATLVIYFLPRRLPLPQAALLALSFGLISYGNQWSYYTGKVMGVLTVAGVSYKGYGMLLLGALLASVLAPRALALLRAWRAGRAGLAAPPRHTLAADR
ncbi:DUF2029 domain-containing protein [Chloroflexia bacterium SDU3-3]|nr:DUF2029 domain-containing protein [Chloroflexia bacterium SDU3-3]